MTSSGVMKFYKDCNYLQKKTSFKRYYFFKNEDNTTCDSINNIYQMRMFCCNHFNKIKPFECNQFLVYFC